MKTVKLIGDDIHIYMEIDDTLQIIKVQDIRCSASVGPIFQKNNVFFFKLDQPTVSNATIN